jgi:hypothetical protein
MVNLTRPTTEEEIAEIIFNSNDSVLNDMLQSAKNNNYEINQLVWRIAADINGHYSDHFARHRSSDERGRFLFERIKEELKYYAKWY